MKTLRIAPGFALSIDVAGEAIAILAKRGAGKTNTATVLVEELVGAGVQVVVLDPVGAWWGIRSSADGKDDGLTVPILGGQHGDVPLEPAAGALISDVVVDTGQSLLLDLSDFPSKAATARFVVDFGERLFRRKARDRSLVHLVLEEADSFAPQKGSGDDARMRGAIEQIVRRGRSRGLGITMVTQRSAVLNKDVLSQADVLVAMRTTSPHDVKAIEAWVDAHGTDEHGVVESLPSLKTGEAWFWNPERGLLERVKVRRRQTFDSSATPKAGERKPEPRQLAPIDLPQLGAEIEATAERAKENDPRELRQRITDLRRRVDQAEAKLLEQASERKQAPTIERVEVPVPLLDSDAIMKLRLDLEPLQAIVDDLSSLQTSLHDSLEHAQVLLRHAPEPPAPATPKPQPRPPASAPVPPRAPREPAVPPDGSFRPSGPQQKILDALAALEAIGLREASKVQLGLFAEASPKSSSYTNNLGALRTAGLLNYPRGGYVSLTEGGRAIADAGGAPSTADELHRFVYGLVGRPKALLLEKLIDVYPEALPKSELAERAGASATSSSFTNNLGSLRSLGLIDYPGPGLVAALPVLFLEAS